MIRLYYSRPYRRKSAVLTEFTTTQLHLRNPWVVAFFSFSYPGFGHLLQHRYAKAIVLFIWELFINTKAQVNLGIMYSLLGNFDMAKEVLNEKWLIFYVGIYMFAIWDSYRGTVDLNKQYVLADRENAPIKPLVITKWDINFLDKRLPWLALVWSAIVPGIGHLYVHKVLIGFIIFSFTLTISYFAHLPQAIQYTMIGEFNMAADTIDMQWALYIPSIYSFVLYDAYVSAVEYNKLFKKELSRYLQSHYQHPKFKRPL